MIANKARGETVLMIDGAPRRLCLTLGALAELETAFEVESIETLAERLGKLTASDLIVVVAALLGEAPDKLKGAEIDVGEAAKAVAEAFKRAIG